MQDLVAVTPLQWPLFSCRPLSELYARTLFASHCNVNMLNGL